LSASSAYAKGRSNCIFFDYDELLADPDYCRTLFDFLGEPFDRPALDRILDRRHSIPTQSYGMPRSMFVNKNADLIAMHGALRAKSVELATLREQLLETRKEAGQLRAQQRASQKLISAMRISTSWKLSAPFRRVGALLKKRI